MMIEDVHVVHHDVAQARTHKPSNTHTNAYTHTHVHTHAYTNNSAHAENTSFFLRIRTSSFGARQLGGWKEIG